MLKMMMRGAQMQYVRRKACGLVLISLVLISSIEVSGYSSKNISDKEVTISKCFYSKALSLPNYIPHIFFDQHDSVHVRSLETGFLENIFRISEDEALFTCDEDSVFLVDIDNHENNKERYRRIDIDGSSESFMLDWQGQSMSGSHKHQKRILILNNEPVSLCLDSDWTDEIGTEENIEYTLYALNSNGILWVKKSTNGVRYDLPKSSISNYRYVYLTKSIINDEDEYLEEHQIIDVFTGDIVRSIPGYYYGYTTATTDYGLLILHARDPEKESNKMINLKNGQTIFEFDFESENSYNISLVKDCVWLSVLDGEIPQYRFGATEPYTLTKFDQNGTIEERLTFKPRADNLTIMKCEVLSDNLVMMTSKTCTYLYNFRTNQRLAVIPYKVDSMYMHDNTLVYQTDRKLVALDTETFEKRWELESVDLERVQMVETEDQLFFGYRYTADTEGCGYGDIEYRMLIRVVNKSTGYKEPYEYDIPFQYNGMDFIYPSPYGLIAIDRYRLYCWAPGNVLVYEIGGIDHPEEIIETDDPRYINIRCVPADNYSYVCRLDMKTGLITVIERHYGDD